MIGVPIRTRWGALGAMTGVQITGSFAFYAVTVLTPFIKAEFGLTRAAVGLLVVGLYLGYLLSLLPGGFLTDQWGERAVLAGAIALLAAGGALVSTVGTYPLLFVGLVVLGAGYGPVPSGTNKGIFDWFPAGQRTTGLSLKQTGVMAGSAAAGVLLPGLAARTDWQIATGAVVGVTVGSLGLLAVYARPADAPTAVRASTLGGLASELADMGRHARDPAFRALLVAGFLFGASQFTLLAYVLLYLTEALGIAPAAAGVLYTVTQLAGAGARIVLGVVTDARFAERKHLLLAATGILGGVAYLPLIGIPAGAPPYAVGLALAFLGSMALGYNGVYLTMATELVAPEETGSATAVAVTAVIAGAVLTPPVFGYVADTTGGFAAPFGLLAALCLLAGVTGLLIGR